MVTLQNRVNAILKIGEEIKNTRRFGYADLRTKIKSIENQWNRLSARINRKRCFTKRF